MKPNLAEIRSSMFHAGAKGSLREARLSDAAVSRALEHAIATVRWDLVGDIFTEEEMLGGMDYALDSEDHFADVSEALGLKVKNIRRAA
jgi:hypothetical protein